MIIFNTDLCRRMKIKTAPLESILTRSEARNWGCEINGTSHVCLVSDGAKSAAICLYSNTNQIVNVIGLRILKMFRKMKECIKYTINYQGGKQWILKFIYSEKATKFCEISTNYLSYVNTASQIGGGFAKFCGLLRICELQKKNMKTAKGQTLS